MRKRYYVITDIDWVDKMVRLVDDRTSYHRPLGVWIEDLDSGMLRMVTTDHLQIGSVLVSEE